MASWLGGLMMGLGGAAAGGFKAAGEVQDEKIKDRSDMLKMEAMATREESLARLRARYQAEDTETKIKADKEIQGMNFAERTKAQIHEDELRAKSEEIRVKERYEDKKDQREYQRQMLEARGSDGSRSPKGSYLTDAKTGKMYFVAPGDKGQMDIREVTGVSGKTDFGDDKNDLNKRKNMTEVISKINEARAMGDTEGMKALAAANDIPLKDVEEIIEKNYIFPDKKRKTTNIDYEAMKSQQSLAAPSSGMNPAEPGTSTGKPGNRNVSIDEVIEIVNGREQGSTKGQTRPTTVDDIMGSSRAPSQATGSQNFNESMTQAPEFGSDVKKLGKSLMGLAEKGQARADMINNLGQETDQNYGKRNDGTDKGNGYLGALKMQDGSGKVASEMAIGIEIDGKETEIPVIVPTLTQQEIDYLLKGNKPTKAIIDKAVDHAYKRLKEGKSPFADETDLMQ